MARIWLVLVLSCACATSPSDSTPETAPPESVGGEGPARSGANDPAVRAMVEGVDELLFAFDSFDEHERWERREENRQAYGDGEDCEGACGLSVPDPGPEPALPDPEELAESFEVLIEASSSWDRAPWTTMVAALRQAASAARGDGDPDERAIAAGNQAATILRDALHQGVTEDASCWLGMRLLAADAMALESALLAASEQASLREEIEYAMDEGEIEEEGVSFMEELNAAMERAGPVVQRATELLEGGPANAESAAAELESLQEIVAPVLERRTLEAFQAQRLALQRVCAL